MPCYTPLGAKLDENGKPVFSRFLRGQPDVLLPCQNCIGCRIDYSREWTVRLQHEQIMSDSSCWITLTYSDKHLPRSVAHDYASLSKTDCQHFFKSVRDRLGPFRYYLAGEYGPKTKRPHYHACIFNAVFPDWQFKYTSDSGHPVYRSQVLTDLWGKGNADVSELTYENAAYTAAYSIKKIKGEKAIEHYRRTDHYGVDYWVEPEFSLQSNRDGIGASFYDKYHERIRAHDTVLLHGREYPTPRYYLKRMEKQHPADYERIKKHRTEALIDNDPSKTLAARTSAIQVRERQQSLKIKSLE